MANLERAIEIANRAHDGQIRLDGSPYVTHPLRVMKTLQTQGHSEVVQMAGVLHDAVEDSDWTIEKLREEGFSDDVLVPIDILTKKEGVDYDEYIDTIAGNAVARVVKMADIFDNLTDYKGSGEDREEWRARKVKKYAASLLRLASFQQVAV